MKKILKASGTLSLSLIVCFTILFADVGIASAESTTTSLGQRGNVKEIKYIYPSSLTYEENTNGQWSIDENGEFFYRYNMNSDCEPEVFTVEYESGEEVTYSRYSGAGDAYWSRSEYKSSTGEKIALTNCVKSNQPEKHFKVGKDNYFTFTFKGATKKIPVEITASAVTTTVQSIEYIPKITEYNYSDACLTYNGARKEAQWRFLQNSGTIVGSINHCIGDELVITDKSGTIKSYTCTEVYNADTESYSYKFISDDGSQIECDLVKIYEEQDIHEWGYGKDCYYIVAYDGVPTKVPVTVKKNDVESISIYVGEDSEERSLSCDAEANFYIDRCLDGIIAHKQGGSTETIKYYDYKYNKYEECETDGYFDSKGNPANLTICHKDFTDSGQWYVYYHGVSCPIKTSHDNTSWEVKTKPTCKKTGLYEKACICGEVVDTAVIPVDENAHKFTSYVYNNDAEVGVDGTETASCDYGCGKTDTRTKSGTALSDSSSIEGILADYYIYRFNTLTGELTLSCKENATAPTYMNFAEAFRESSLYVNNREVKKIHLAQNFKPLNYDSFLYVFFSYFTRLEAYTVEDSNSYFSADGDVLFNKEKTILHSYPARKLGDSYTIPESVIQVGDGDEGSPFECVWYLKTVRISKTVKTISENSFVNRQIGDGNSIEEFIVDNDNPNYKALDGVLFSKDGKTLITYPSSKKSDNYIIPEGVTKIGDRAFSLTRNLKKVTIPEGIEIIGYDAFYGMYGYIGKLTIPASVSSIGEDAFALCGNKNKCTSINFSRNSQLNEFPKQAFSRLGENLVINIPCKTWTVDLECTVELTHEGE